MPPPGRLTRSDLEILRRSVAASGQLPRDELDRLLAETARLLDERDAVLSALADMGPPWRDVRGALNELFRIVASAPPPAHGSGTPADGRSA